MNLGAVKVFVVWAVVVASWISFVSFSTAVSREFVSWMIGFGAVVLNFGRRSSW